MAAAQTVMHAAEARLATKTQTQPSHDDILREANKDPLATPEVLAEVERMLRARQRST